MKRILLVAPVLLRELEQECENYVAAGYEVTVNSYLLDDADLSQARKSGLPFTATRFDPDLEQALVCEFEANGLGYDALVIPYPHRCGTALAIATMAANKSVAHQLAVVATPNDSFRHIGKTEDLSNRIRFIGTNGIHRLAVAEYVLGQLLNAVRQFSPPVPLDNRSWQRLHATAVTTTHVLRGKTLGVIGASGRDGNAVANLAMSFGLQVISEQPIPRSTDAATVQRALSKREALLAMGIGVVDEIADVFAATSLISVHRTVVRHGSDATIGDIGKRELSALQRGTIMTNTAGADLFDKHALFETLERPNFLQLILDMPFVESDGSIDLDSIDNRRLLQYSNVKLTPRVSGYTVETRLTACRDVAGQIKDYFSNQNT